MVLFYSRINWENYPSVVTPINEINLNKIDYAAKTLDERTVELYNTKAEKSVVLNTVKEWFLDENTGIITITKVNGDVVNFDLNIEKIPVNFELSEEGVLTMTTDDGSAFTADIGKMIPIFVFENTETITFEKKNKRTLLASDFSTFTYEFAEPFDGNFVATVVPPENTGMMQPIHQFDVLYTYQNGLTFNSFGMSTEKELFISINEDVKSVEITTTTENNIISLEMEYPKEVVVKAHIKEGSINDNYLEPNYLANVTQQAENAKLSENASKDSANEAKSYTVGGTGTREGEDTDNAKYYMQEAKRAAQSGGGGGGSIDLPVSIDNGGTGGTTTKSAQYNLLNDISERTEEITDDDYSTLVLSTPSATNGFFAKFKITLLWNYIKPKINSVLGLTETNYSGISAKATADAEGNVINDTYATKDEISKIGGSSNIALNTQTLGYVKKNLLENTSTTQTINGVTFTVNSDGSVSAVGKTSSSFDEGFIVGEFVPEIGKSYIFTDGGQSNSTIYCYVTGVDGTTNKYKNGDVFTPTTNKDITCKIVIHAPSYDCDYTFFPMIRDANITDDTYAPYAEDVDTRLKELTPVNNLLATVAGKPLDAVQGKVLNDKLETLGGFEPVIDETGKITGYKTEIGGADTVFPFSSGAQIEVGTFSASGSEVVDVVLGFKPKLLIVGNESNYNYIRIYNEEFSTTQQIMASTVGNMSTINLNGDGGGGGAISSINDDGFSYMKVTSSSLRAKRYIAVG